MSFPSKKADLSDSTLVKLALSGADKVRVGDVSSNQASARLRDRGACVLPVIEEIVSRETQSTDANGLKLVRFHGLSSVFVTYFEIAKKESQIERASEFIKSLAPAAQYEALTAIWSIWLGRTPRERIPTSLLCAIQTIASDGRDEQNQQASSLLQTHAKMFRSTN